jgi:hypothetical protein
LRVVAEEEHFVIEAGVGPGVIRVRRTTRPFNTIWELEAAFDRLNAHFSKLVRNQMGLVMDLRAGSVRNDPVFESALERKRKVTLAGFRRVALLVQTSLGVLQCERHARIDGIPYFVTMSEAAALQHVTPEE